MNDYIALLLGAICAGVGGELFVKGVVGLASWLRVSSGIIAATVAAFATSSPELSVAVNSAIDRQPKIALGDALGSNVVNISLVLALALIISRIEAPGDGVKRDFFVALIAPIVTFLLLIDGVLSRGDGWLILTIFFAWIVTVTIEARNQRSAANEVLGEHRTWLIFVFCIAGFVLLVIAGKLVLTGGKGIATALGIDPFVIGATVVALGTSLPELATVIIAKMRGHEEVGLGAILGSNIFNNLFIVGTTATIYPIVVDWQEVAIALFCGLVAVGLTFPGSSGWIRRRRGILLFVLYGLYLLLIVLRSRYLTA